MYPVCVCGTWCKTAMVGLLKPGRKTKSITCWMRSSTSAPKSRMKLGEYGTSLNCSYEGTDTNYIDK
jgi:hypothetical protein